MHLTGRDVREATFAMRFDEDRGEWNLLDGPASDYLTTDERRRILRTLREDGPASPKVIAERSGVSRGTVFNYFPNKETILVAYFARQLDDLARRAAELRARPTGPGAPEFDGLAEIRYLFAELAGFVQAHRELVLPISFELLDPNEERSRAAYLAIPLVELLRSALKRAQAAGTVRADYSAERLARTLANVYFITALQWAAYRHDRDAREEFAVALRLALEGLVAAG